MSYEIAIRKLQQNWKSGLTVSLVSIPLSVSLAVASQSTPVAGIITAIWAGLFAALFGGSHFNIVGPTGALSGFLATYAIMHGSDTLASLAIVVGLFTLVAYFFKLERFLVFVPASTIQGFTVGVAFIIALNQLNYAVGLTGLPLHEKFIDNITESFRHLGGASAVAVTFFAVSLAALFALRRLTPSIPGPIVIAPIGILFGYLSSARLIPYGLQTLGMKFPDMSAKLFELPTLQFDPSLLTAGLAVAFVAILETMISAKIADGMTKTRHDKRKEMFGLGLANLASGAMGGIPATAALARTSLNVKCGATDRMSGIVNAVAVAVISLVLLRYFQFIPMAVIAAILVFVAARMIEHEHLVRMYRVDRKGFFLAIAVALVTVAVDPIIGILAGMAVALLIFVEKLSRGQFDLIINGANKQIVDKISGETLRHMAEDCDTLVYSVKGQLAYVNAQAHISRFEERLAGHATVVLRLRELYFIDMDGVDAFEEIVELIKGQKKAVYVTGVNPLIAAMLQESKHYRQLKEEGKVLERTSDVLKILDYQVG